MEIKITFDKTNGVSVKVSEQITIAELVGMLEIAKAVLLDNKMEKVNEEETEEINESTTTYEM